MKDKKQRKNLGSLLKVAKECPKQTKSGDSSLRDWFSKSKSSDGKHLVGFNSVANMQENPVPDNQDKQLNPSAVLVR